MGRVVSERRASSLFAVLLGLALLAIGVGPVLAQAQTNTPVQSVETTPVSNYWLTAEYATDGKTIVLDGYVPDAITLKRLGETLNLDTTRLEIASGAPQRFASALDFGLEALSRMQSGRFAMRGPVLTLRGSAKTAADYEVLLGIAAAGPPQGAILAMAEITAPLASPFIWSAEKDASGAIALSGYVPSAAVRATLVTAISSPGGDSMTFASGQPDGFEASALAGLAVLDKLDTGALNFDGESWSLTGTVDSAQKGFAAESAFVATGLAAAGWSYEVALPEPEIAEAPPAVDTFTWSVEKIPNGAITFNGYAPSDEFKRYFATRADGVVFDNTAIAEGAPDTFVAEAMAGFDALQQLEEGRLSFAAGQWTLDGKAANAASRDCALAFIGAASEADTWSIDVAAAGASGRAVTGTGGEPRRNRSRPQNPQRSLSPSPNPPKKPGTNAGGTRCRARAHGRAGADGRAGARARAG